MVIGIIISIILGVSFGVCLCVWGAKNPLTIKFPYHPLDWIIPIAVAFLSVIFAFAVEYIAVYIVGALNLTSGIWNIIKKMVENGLLVPFLCVIASLLFEKRVESLHLNYLTLYSNLVAKVCFTILTLVFCGVVYVGIMPKYYQNDYLVDLLSNRICVWVLAVIGTWLGFGYGCDREVINLIKKHKNNKDDKKEQEINFWGFWTPIILGNIFFSGVLFVLISKWAEKFTVYLCAFAVSFGLIAFIVSYYMERNTNPSDKLSQKIFSEAENKHKKNKVAEGQYKQLRYKLDKDSLIIFERDVIYKGHEDDEELKALFGAVELPLVYFDSDGEDTPQINYEVAKAVLVNRLEKQAEYVKKEVENCISREREKRVKTI